MSLPKKTQVGNWNYPSWVTINARGKDRTPNGLGDEFSDLWFDDLVQAQAIRASFLLESNHGFDRRLLRSSLIDCELTKESSSPLSRLLEQGLFEPERGEGQMAGQRQAKYAASVGTQLLAKIHVLHEKMIRLDQRQDHPIDRLDECVDFVGEATDRVGRVVDELNHRIDAQDIQIEQLANMVNDLVGMVESQSKEIKQLKSNQETQHKVLNNLTAKFITLEECVEDIQKKAFPKVSGV